jgi:hypothetical protein
MGGKNTGVIKQVYLSVMLMVITIQKLKRKDFTHLLRHEKFGTKAEFRQNYQLPRLSHRIYSTETIKHH